MLVEAFLRAVGSTAATWRSRADLSTQLEQRLQQALAAFPGVRLEAEFVGATLGRSLAGAAAESLDAVSLDVVLAAAALAGDVRAVALFDAVVVSEAKQAAQHLRAGASFADELAQQLRQRMLSPPAPKLADYAGRGSLKKWLRASAMRLGINLASAEGRHRTDGDDDEALGQLQASAASPELAVVKAETAALVTEALRLAFSKLSPKERNLLRLYFLDGVSSTQLAKTYGTHRVTVTRWLATARTTVVEAAIAQLREQGALSASTSGSDLQFLVRSQLGEGWLEGLRHEEG